MGQASVEKLEHTRPAEKESVSSVPTERAVGKYTRAAFAERKRNKAVSPEYLIVRGERVKEGESRTLARAFRGKGGLHSEGRQIPRMGGRVGKESLPRK